MSLDLNTHRGVFIVQAVNQKPDGFFQIFDGLTLDKRFTQDSLDFGLHTKHIQIWGVKIFLTISLASLASGVKRRWVIFSLLWLCQCQSQCCYKTPGTPRRVSVCFSPSSRQDRMVALAELWELRAGTQRWTHWGVWWEWGQYQRHAECKWSPSSPWWPVSPPSSPTSSSCGTRPPGTRWPTTCSTGWWTTIWMWRWD